MLIGREKRSSCKAQHSECGLWQCMYVLLVLFFVKHVCILILFLEFSYATLAIRTNASQSGLFLVYFIIIIIIVFVLIIKMIVLI